MNQTIHFTDPVKVYAWESVQTYIYLKIARNLCLAKSLACLVG